MKHILSIILALASIANATIVLNEPPPVRDLPVWGPGNPATSWVNPNLWYGSPTPLPGVSWTFTGDGRGLQPNLTQTVVNNWDNGDNIPGNGILSLLPPTLASTLIGYRDIRSPREQNPFDSNLNVMYTVITQGGTFQRASQQPLDENYSTFPTWNWRNEVPEHPLPEIPPVHHHPDHGNPPPEHPEHHSDIPEPGTLGLLISSGLLFTVWSIRLRVSK